MSKVKCCGSARLRRQITANRRPSVDASHGTFNDVGRDQHNINITHIENGRNDIEIIALRTERLIHRIAIAGAAGFFLLLGITIASFFMYVLSLTFEF